jgi:thiopeptide-type bacteriocin biosynthesis protein
MYLPIDAFLLRAPLLPAAAWRRGARALEKHPLGGRAIELASPRLAAAKPGAARERAWGRYGRRAAFRATPHGLLAGVCVGTLGRATNIATGTPEEVGAARWADVDEIARELLDDADLRARTRFRLAPSAFVGATHVRWLGPGEPFGETREATLDAMLATIVAATHRWAYWSEVRSRLTLDMPSEDDANDDLLLSLVDAGLLQSDLAPPLVGPPPERFLAARLEALGRPDLARGLSARLGDGAAMLVHHPTRPPVLARAAVERAARLVPLLVGLHEALAPPAAERLAQPALADALDALTEGLGAGAFALDALAVGDYGVEPVPDDVAVNDDGSSPGMAAQGSVLALLVDAVAGAAARRQPEAPLDPVALATALTTNRPAALPPTTELFLTPCQGRLGARPGTGWLVGLHAPAGASLGRFAHALGAPLVRALEALDQAERRTRPEEERLDIAFAPSPTLAELAVHPKVRRRTLAITRWNDDDDLAPRFVELVADPAAPDGLALRLRGSRGVLIPSPFARIRSATAPAGALRLLAAWTLQRQHAPWAMPLGPLAELAFVPRLSLDGFVILPASWRLPAAGGRGAIARWRKQGGVPRFVQVGEGDELMPVDLEAPDAASDLEGHRRAFEIWPPLDDVVDDDGRRVEAVVMLVDEPDAEADAARARLADAVFEAYTIDPPCAAPPAPGWRTFKLFGALGHQDAVIGSEVLPTIAAARAAGEIDRWFFLRYIDGPGRRPHLRLRVHETGVGASRFEPRLSTAIAPARARAAITGLEIADYHPEIGRFAARELEAIHALYEADSDLFGALLEGDAFDDDLGRVVACVRTADALAQGLGLGLEARHELARERRRAADAGAELDDDARGAADLAFRAAGRGLRAALGEPPFGPFADHQARVAEAARSLPPESRARLSATLLHQSAVRFFGPDRDSERLTLTFWERVLGGLRRR